MCIGSLATQQPKRCIGVEWERGRPAWIINHHNDALLATKSKALLGTGSAGDGSRCMGEACLPRLMPGGGFRYGGCWVCGLGGWRGTGRVCHTAALTFPTGVEWQWARLVWTMIHCSPHNPRVQVALGKGAAGGSSCMWEACLPGLMPGGGFRYGGCWFGDSFLVGFSCFDLGGC